MLDGGQRTWKMYLPAFIAMYEVPYELGATEATT